MARLQKKHSSKDKNKRKNKTDSAEKNNAQVVAAGSKSSTSSSKKGNSITIKSSAPKKPVKDNFFKKGLDYLTEVQSELKKVTWPTRKQTIGTTVVVIVLVAIVSVFLGLFDWGFSQLIQAVLA